jgi:hypothetical protein
MEEISENLTASHSIKLTNMWLELLKSVFLSTPQDLPEIILILSLICTVGGKLRPIPSQCSL